MVCIHTIYYVNYLNIDTYKRNFSACILFFVILTLNLFKLHKSCHYSKETPLNRKEFIITETELKLIAAAANIGDNNRPKKG